MLINGLVAINLSSFAVLTSLLQCLRAARCHRVAGAASATPGLQRFVGYHYLALRIANEVERFAIA